MKSDEVRALSTDELRSRLDDARHELMNLRFQQAIGGLTDYTRLRHTRRTIARYMTILKERQVQPEEEGEA
jgi:large subunit ribosomal protein L29